MIDELVKKIKEKLENDLMDSAKEGHCYVSKELLANQAHIKFDEILELLADSIIEKTIGEVKWFVEETGERNPEKIKLNKKYGKPCKYCGFRGGNWECKMCGDVPL